MAFVYKGGMPGIDDLKPDDFIGLALGGVLGYVAGQFFGQQAKAYAGPVSQIADVAVPAAMGYGGLVLGQHGDHGFAGALTEGFGWGSLINAGVTLANKAQFQQQLRSLTYMKRDDGESDEQLLPQGGGPYGGYGIRVIGNISPYELHGKAARILV